MLVNQQIIKFAELAANKNKKKKKPGSNFPWLPMAPLAASGAGLGLAYGLASDKHTEMVRKLHDDYYKPLQDHETPISRYAVTMSPGANTTPFGYRAGDIVMKAREMAPLMRMLGMNEHDLSAKKKFDLLGSINHYQEFGRGPVPGYYHGVAHSQSGNSDVHVGGEQMKYKDAVMPYLQAQLEKYKVEKLQGSEGGYPLETYMVNPDDVPYEDQAEILKKYHESLPPELQKIRKEVEGRRKKEYDEAFSNYSDKAIKPALLVRDVAKRVGFTSGGAALGGLLGHYLHQKLSKNKEKDWRYYLSTLAGSGLGAAAGFYGSKPTQTKNASIAMRCVQQTIV